MKLLIVAIFVITFGGGIYARLTDQQKPYGREEENGKGLVGSSAGGGHCPTTVETTEGPFYKAGAPKRHDSTICDWQKLENATQLLVHGRVYSAGCKHGQPAVLDIWSADPNGHYSARTGNDYTCRGMVAADSDGSYKFLSIIPGRYLASGRVRPAHIHVKVKAVGQSRAPIFTTQLYFKDDPYLRTDPCPYRHCHAGDPTVTFPLEQSEQKSYMMRADLVISN